MTMKINFALHLSGVGIDRNPKTWYLTICAILNSNNGAEGAVRIQEEILNGINTQGIIGSGIYKYPKETIHFSIINFRGLASDTDTEEEFRQKRLRHIEKIKSILRSFDGQKIIDKKVQFAYIYTGDPNKCKDKPESISIQAFPSNEFWNFIERVKENLEEDSDLRPAKIKRYLYDGCARLPVNIARFFRELSNDEYEIIAENVYNFNKGCQDDANSGKYGFELEINKLSFVLSDNWLSNDNPELCNITLS